MAKRVSQKIPGSTLVRNWNLFIIKFTVMLIFRITYEHAVRTGCEECFKQLVSVGECHNNGIVDVQFDFADPYYAVLKGTDIDYEESLTRHTCPFNLKWVSRKWSQNQELMILPSDKGKIINPKAMRLTDEQWLVINLLIPKTIKSAKGGRPRVPSRPVMDGILWILKTGARWKDLPREFPAYQTCHRRFQEWNKNGTILRVLTALAQDMEERGKLNVSECFMDGSLIPAKKGGLLSGLLSGAKAARSWAFQTSLVFRSPSTWPLLLRMKSAWWKKRLPVNLPEMLRYAW